MKFPNTDQAITDVDDIDDSEESPVISASTAIASLETGQCGKIYNFFTNIEKFVVENKLNASN